MRRIVLIALLIESLMAMVVVFGAITERTDAAGRGLANAYALATAIPVVVGLLLWFAGWTRTAGGVTLVLPLLAAFTWWSGAASRRRVEAAVAGDGWFSDPRVLALTRAIADGETASMRAAIAADPARLSRRGETTALAAARFHMYDVAAT